MTPRFLLALTVVAGCDKIFALEPVELPADEPRLDAAFDAPRPDGEPTGCPAAYNVRLRSTASLYLRVFEHLSWSSARTTCASDSSPAGSRTHLVVLSNDAERAELQPLLTEINWIGLTDSVTSKTFRWITDENTAGYVTAGSGAPWAPGEPDGSGNCVWIDPGGALHDKSCAGGASYICECDARAENPANF